MTPEEHLELARRSWDAFNRRVAFVNELRDRRFVYAHSFLDAGEAFADMARRLRR